MVKVSDLRRRGRHNTNFRKCTAIAAVLSALIVMGVEFAGGGPVSQAKAGIGDTIQTGAGPAEARVPASSAR